MTFVNDPDLPSSLKGLSSAAALAAELAKLSPSSDDVNTFAEVVSKHLTANKYTSTEAGMTYTINNLPDGYYFIKDATASASMPAGATYSRYMLNIVQSLMYHRSKGHHCSRIDKQIRHNEHR